MNVSSSSAARRPSRPPAPSPAPPHGVPGGLHPLRVGAQPVRRVVAGDPGQEGAVPVVEDEVLGEVGVVPDLGRVDDGVQDQAPHPVRVQLGVDGAQVGAVRVAEVVHLPRAERRADGVHVPRGAHRVDVRQQVPVLLAARLGEGPRAREVGLLDGLGGGQGVGAHRAKWPGRQFRAGSLRPTPRGSKPITSYWAATSSGSEDATNPASVRPLPPGPPGLTSSGPW